MTSSRDNGMLRVVAAICGNAKYCNAAAAAVPAKTSSGSNLNGYNCFNASKDYTDCWSQIVFASELRNLQWGPYFVGNEEWLVMRHDRQRNRGCCGCDVGKHELATAVTPLASCCLESQPSA